MLTIGKSDKTRQIHFNKINSFVYKFAMNANGYELQSQYSLKEQ